MAHAPALPGWGAGAGAGAAGEGLLGGFLSRLFGPLSLALAPSTLGDSSIYPLYRVVGPEELADIGARGGQFAFAPGQMEVKQFALSLNDAQYYRDQVIGKLQSVDQLSIVQTTVTGPTFKQLEKMILDFRPAAVVTPVTLPAVNNDAKKFGVQKVGG
jgi:hypothetical protein